MEVIHAYSNGVRATMPNVTFSPTALGVSYSCKYAAHSQLSSFDGTSVAHLSYKQPLRWIRLKIGRQPRKSIKCSHEYKILKDLQVSRASTGEQVPLLSQWDVARENVCVVSFLTHFADLSSWEYAQKLVSKVLPALDAKGIPLIAVGLGSVANARRFAEILSFPLDKLYADPEGLCYTALGFSPGFGQDVNVSPYLKLLPMLMGIGSPGTIQEVLRGYVGDRSAPPIFEGETPFNILGAGYQRPFELATLRLSNMVSIVPKWGELCPPQARLLTQQGGTMVFRDQDTVFIHRDSGILKYVDIEALLRAL